MKHVLMFSFAVCLLSGCSLLFPTHPGLHAFGVVTRADKGTPVEGASISVFGSTFRTGAGGCFKFQLADALPFQFKVENLGARPAVSVPPRGYFQVSVALAPEGAGTDSTVSWIESSEQAFDAAASCG